MTAAFNYARIAKSAKRLIDRFGGDLDIVATSIVPNPEGWKPGTSTPYETALKGVFTKYEEKYIDGTVIQRGDQKVLIAAQGVTMPPNLTGFLKRGTEKWTIVKIEPLCPGDTNIIYKIQVRQ